MNAIQDVFQLRTFLHKEKEGMEARFVVKVFYILKLTRNEADANITGLIWAPDKMHFYTNSRLLGLYLSIKPNSINTNFRLYGFKLVPVNQREIAQIFPTCLSGKWMRRRSEAFSFTDMTL